MFEALTNQRVQQAQAENQPAPVIVCNESGQVIRLSSRGRQGLFKPPQALVVNDDTSNKVATEFKV